jgi:hypothetical protein
MSEQREILRRIAERGLKLAQEAIDDPENYVTDDDSPLDMWITANRNHLDLWQHMLDEIARLGRMKHDGT